MNSENFEKQMASITLVLEQAGQEVLVEALLSACNAIISQLNKSASGQVLELWAAQLAASFIQDNQGAGRRREILSRFNPARASIN